MKRSNCYMLMAVAFSLMLPCVASEAVQTAAKDVLENMTGKNLAKLYKVRTEAETADQREVIVQACISGLYAIGDAKNAKKINQGASRDDFMASLMVECDLCHGAGCSQGSCYKCKGSGACQNRKCSNGTVMGVGFDGRSNARKCSNCGGTGKCANCKGTGKVARTCSRCNGSKRVIDKTVALASCKDKLNALIASGQAEESSQCAQSTVARESQSREKTADTVLQDVSSESPEECFRKGECYANGEGVEKNLGEAVKWYRKAAERGCVDAQWQLARCYHRSKGVKYNPDEVFKWYRKAAEQDHAEAQRLLGYCYESGIGVEKNNAEGMKWHRKAAEHGDATAQRILGKSYLSGETIEKNPAEAVKWFRKGAENGDAACQVCLGDCYLKGEGIEKDRLEAFKLYAKAAQQGYSDGELNFKMLNLVIIECYRKEAERGDVTALRALGDCYFGGYGVEVSRPNPAKAVRWYFKAAEQGDAIAQLRLALCYENGMGIAKDENEAIRWYRKAADQGQANAQYFLGVKCSLKCYESEAMQWFLKAAEQGLAEAQFECGECYLMGVGVEKDLQKAAQWYRKAAESGNVDGEYRLGYCYFFGKGLEMNHEEGAKWCRKAAAKGHDKAKETLQSFGK